MPVALASFQVSVASAVDIGDAHFATDSVSEVNAAVGGWTTWVVVTTTVRPGTPGADVEKLEVTPDAAELSVAFELDAALEEDALELEELEADALMLPLPLPFRVDEHAARPTSARLARTTEGNRERLMTTSWGTPGERIDGISNRHFS